MAADGKQLEALVAFVEETLVPAGFKVELNNKVYNDEGTQIAEFDVEVSGRVGSTDIRWLIECRDRPGQGAAPGSWIEQLVGRRDRFNFNKVTAVSTTGFAAGALQYAKEAGIELREVAALTPEGLSWITIPGVEVMERIATLHTAEVEAFGTVSKARQNALKNLLKSQKLDSPILSQSDGGKVSLAQAFSMAVNASGQFSSLTEKDGVGTVTIDASYTEDQPFVINTLKGAVAIERIKFQGTLQAVKSVMQPDNRAEYRSLDATEPISQVASYTGSIAGSDVSLEFHRIPQSGQTHILMRKTGVRPKKL